MVPFLNAIGDNAAVNVTYQKENKHFKWAMRPQPDGSLNIECNGTLYAKYNSDTKLLFHPVELFQWKMGQWFAIKNRWVLFMGG